MDPATSAIVAPWAQYGILGSVVIALGFVVVFLWRALDKRTEAHLDAVQKCHDQTLEANQKQTESNGQLAIALNGLKDVVLSMRKPG